MHLQDQAAWPSPQPLLKGLFDAVRPVLSDVEPSVLFDKAMLLERVTFLENRFDEDMKRLRALGGMLFGRGTEEYGAQAAETFGQWEQEGLAVSMPALTAAAIDAFGIDPLSTPVQAAYLSAILAEYPNGLQYHGNAHYRKVLTHAIRLIATHNQIHAHEGALDSHAIALLLAASCIHDLGHQGGDNMRGGVYTPGYQEQQATEFARPYFDALELDRDDILDIEAIVFCTDITFSAGDNSPCIRMKRIFKSQHWNSGEDVSLLLLGRMRRFEDNPLLSLMAMLLHEADIASSAGLTYAQTIAETINIMEERGVKTAGPGTVLCFLREQLGETMFTQAARQLFGTTMAGIIAQAEQEKAAGRKTFYE